jgi:hypothetical protein
VEKKNGWQQSGILRIQQSGRVMLSANFKDSQYGSGMYTVQLAINQKPSIAGANPDATATIIWMVEGNQVVRQVSVGNGVSVSGTGQACNIIIEDTTVFTSVPAVGAEYVVSAQVAPGTRAGRAFPPILRGLANGVAPNARLWPAIPAAGGTVQWLVPENAGVIAVCPQVVPDTFGTTLDPYDITAYQRDAFGNVVKAWLPLIDFGFVPVVPSAVEMFIDNRSAAAIIRAAVEWGIDG